MASTLTRSASQTTSYQKIVPVTRKVLADLLAIFETYDYFSEDHAAQLINDIRTFLYENVIERVQFIWLEAGTNQVLDAFSYRVILNGLGLADDRSGGIRYRSELAEAHFNVRLFYNDRWNKLEEPERREIRNSLRLSWGPGGQLDYSNGRWLSDRTYSFQDYGLERTRFQRW